MKTFRLWLRWVFANSMGEMVGLGITFGIGYLIVFYLGEMESVGGIFLTFGLMVATSIIEGTAVGIAQYWGMHPLVHRPDDHRLGIKQGVWLRATILGALVAWFFGALPFMAINLFMNVDTPGASSAEPPAWIIYLLAAGVGVVAGAVLAFFQWRALRRHFFGAGWWIPANSLAWAVGMPVIFIAMDYVFSGLSPVVMVLAFLAALALTGAVVGAIHGVFLIWIARKPRDRNGEMVRAKHPEE
jgi:hypothetical protein